MTEKFDGELPPGGIFGEPGDPFGLGFVPLTDAELDAADEPVLRVVYKLLRQRFERLQELNDYDEMARQERRESRDNLNHNIQTALQMGLSFQAGRDESYRREAAEKREHEARLLQMQHDLILKLATKTA